MAEFKAFSKDVEVMGQAVLSIVDAMEIVRARALRILGNGGITDLKPDHWYPMQTVLDTFKTIFDKIGPHTVLAIGRKIPANVPFPPQIKTIEDGLRSIEIAYRMNHRGAGKIGSYAFESTGNRKAKLLCDNPYPCAMDQGLIEAVADRFRPKDSLRVSVVHAPGECRHTGGDSCAYLVAW